MDPNILYKRGRLKNFELDAGCQQILFDKKGNLWISTCNTGVLKYDGRNFTRITTNDGLYHNCVAQICIDKNDNLWILTVGGLKIFNGEALIEPAFDQTKLCGYAERILFDKNGTVWIAAENELYRFDGSSLHTVQLPDNTSRFNTISGLFEDSQGTLWIGAVNTIYQINKNDIRTLTPEDGLTGSHFFNFIEDAEHCVWISAREGALFFKDGKLRQKPDLLPSLPETVFISSFFLDKDNNIWGGLDSGAIFCFDGQNYVLFSAEDGINCHGGLGVARDAEGVAWFSAGYAGLYSFDPYGLSRICDLKPSEMPGIIPGKKSLWPQQNKIICQYDSFTKAITTSITALANIRFMCLCKDDTYWIATNPGLVRATLKTTGELENSVLVIPIEKIDQDFIWCLFVDRDNCVWIGSRHHLHRYDGLTLKHIYSIDNTWPHNGIRSVVQDKHGDIWFASENEGVGHITSEGIAWFKKEQGLASTGVLAMVIDANNTIWVGTTAGLSWFNGTRFESLTLKDGLPGEFIHRLYIDRSGMLWMGTIGAGVIRYNGKHLQVLSKEDGLDSNNINGISEEPDGTFLIATYKGMYSYRKRSNNPPSVTIYEAIADRSHTNPNDICFSDTIPLLRVKFHANSWATARPRYLYKLVGHDPQWIATWEEEVSYEKLPVGSYIFKVIAVNRDLVAGEYPAELHITVTPDPRGWVIEELATQVRERTRALEEANLNLSFVNRELDDFAYAVSHDLKAPLRAITSLAAWISQDYREKLGEDGAGQLSLLCQRADKMRSLIDGVLRYSRLGRTAMELVSVNLNEVVSDVKQMLAPPETVHIDILAQLPTVIADRVRMHEVFQNLISNAIKYNDKPECRIAIGSTETNSIITIRIADNGPGIEPKFYERIFKLFETLAPTQNTESTGVGLALVEKIITMLGGRVWVESVVGTGAVFCFTILTGGPHAKLKTNTLG